MLDKRRYRNRVEFKGCMLIFSALVTRRRYRNRVEFKVQTYGMTFSHGLVDIETEWNLKKMMENPMVKNIMGRYRNRVEFKAKNALHMPCTTPRRYRNRVEFKVSLKYRSTMCAFSRYRNRVEFKGKYLYG